MPESNRTLMRFQWKAHKLLWNLTGGRLGRRIAGLPILELITIGHKTGDERQILISYIDVDGTPVIIGTNAGRDTDPAWAKNLRANPEARARWAGNWRTVWAVELNGTDREQAWIAAVDANPLFEQYAESLSRPIPVFRLVRR